jgi:hypothetical protein
MSIKVIHEIEGQPFEVELSEGAYFDTEAPGELIVYDDEDNHIARFAAGKWLYAVRVPAIKVVGEHKL